MKITNLMGRVGLVGLLLALAPMVEAQRFIPIPAPISAGVSNTYGTITLTNFTSTGSSTGTNTTIYRLDALGPQADVGLVLPALISQPDGALSVGPGTNIYAFNYLIGGTWTTTLPLTITVTNGSSTLGGTNLNVGYFALARTNLPGVTAIRLDAFTTSGTNTVTPLPIVTSNGH